MMRRFTAAAALLSLAAACAPAESGRARAASDPQSPLAGSSPAAGARVAAPSDLRLVFRAPVRLAEVTVSGPDGLTVPMMISSAGEQTSYSLPLDGLEPGDYSVRWRAVVVGGASREGSFRFTVRR